MATTEGSLTRDSAGADLDRNDQVRDSPAGAPVHTVDGAVFRELLNAGLIWLDRYHEVVNALNVFPVPDGDTGTNMLLTMKSACLEITDEDIQSVGEVARAAAHGALMGARGNSGVILSQILRGFARTVDGERVLTGPLFAAALTEASRIAYKGVNRPVEGTILTVVREAAAAAESAAANDPALHSVMVRTVRAADQAVANTPKLLPILAQTGKVDSGGKGLFFILEGMYRALIGEAVTAEAAPARALAAVPAVVPRPAKGQRALPPIVYGFDVQFLVEGQNLDIAAIRQQITSMGDCPLVEGDTSLAKVHVHVPNPGVPLSYAVGLGFVTEVTVENMDDMHLPEMPSSRDMVPPRFEISQDDQSVAPSLLQPEPAALEGPAIIAVAPGPGLAQVFKSLGTHYVVSGGQTMNPSTKDFLQAIEKVGNSQVIILPNNGNVIMAAQLAVQQAQAEQSTATSAGMESKSFAVVPSRSVPQGISALLALNLHGDWERNVRAMTAALDRVRTGEVTVAAHDARFDGIEVHAGDIIGLLDDRLTAKGSTSEAVARILLEQMGAADLEVITLYYGQPITAETAKALQGELAELYPDQEIEVIDGGQPFYHYIISAE